MQDYGLGDSSLPPVLQAAPRSRRGVFEAIKVVGATCISGAITICGYDLQSCGSGEVVDLTSQSLHVLCRLKNTSQSDCPRILQPALIQRLGSCSGAHREMEPMHAWSNV